MTKSQLLWVTWAKCLGDLAVLSEAGYQPKAIDLSIESLDEETIRQAKFIAISAPMHTALRIGEQAAKRVRALNPGAHICFYGHYAWLNKEHLLKTKNILTMSKTATIEKRMIILSR